MRKLAIFFVSLTSLSIQAEDLLVDHSTYFKKSTAQSSTLPASGKCQVFDNTLVSAKSIETNGDHLKVTLQNNLTDCAFTTGYFYRPHVSREANLITLTQQSIFKLKNISASYLPKEQKCDISPGVYSTNNTIGSVVDDHYSVTLKKLTPNCSFNSGYLYEGHTKKGALAVQLTADSYLKKSAKQASQLPASEKCYLPIGLYPLGAGASSFGEEHYKITLASNLPNCSFNSGYVYYDHTNWKQPYVEPSEPDFTFPLPGGYYTSGWCKCRNIGTSPHIGQDISKAGTKNAIAVQDGKVTSTTYSSSCGYISYIKDEWGTNWRYVHLNRPAVAEGRKIDQGQHFASISQYPKSGCGSGPHLHFERRSAGYFGDSSTGKSCQNGYRSCYYDPIKPWRSGYNSKQVSSRQDSSKQDIKVVNWSQSDSSMPSSCKVPLANLAQIERERFESYGISNNQNITVNFEIIDRHDLPSLFNASAYLDNNKTNLCKGNRCAVHWQLVAESNEGQLTTIFYHNRTRNVALLRETEEKFCLPENATRYWMLIKDNKGNKLRVEIK